MFAYYNENKQIAFEIDENINIKIDISYVTDEFTAEEIGNIILALNKNKVAIYRFVEFAKDKDNINTNIDGLTIEQTTDIFNTNWTQYTYNNNTFQKEE